MRPPRKEQRVSFCIRYKGRGRIPSFYDVSPHFTAEQAIEKVRGFFARDYSSRNAAFSADSFKVALAPNADEQRVRVIDELGESVTVHCFNLIHKVATV
jgi:hypothetical protein